MRLLSFWLGLPVLLFLLWAWRDSMVHPAALHRPHGRSFAMVWPPVDPKGSLPPLPSISSGGFDFELPEIPSFGDFNTNPLYYDASIPSSRQMPLLPHRSLPLRPDDLYRSASQRAMQPYHSIGSKEGVIWFSSWISPSTPRMPGWSYTTQPPSGTWFPAPEWTHNESLHSSTLRIPYWPVISLYALCWLAILKWRGRRLKKGLVPMTVPVPSP